MSNPDSWEEWSVHVRRELERLNANYEALREDVAGIRTELAMLKVKAGLFGAVGAAIPVVALLIIERL